MTNNIKLAFEKYLIDSELHLDESKKGLKAAHDHAVKGRLLFRLTQVLVSLVGISAYITAILFVKEYAPRVFLEMVVTFFTTTWVLNAVIDWQRDKAMDKEYNELMNKSIFDKAEELERQTGAGLIDLDKLKEMKRLKN